MTSLCNAQGYISDMARCIQATGQDMETRAGDRLQQILEEYCCLHLVRARTAPARWRSLLTWTNIQGPSSQGIAASPPPPDWLALAVRSQLACNFGPSYNRFDAAGVFLDDGACVLGVLSGDTFHAFWGPYDNDRLIHLPTGILIEPVIHQGHLNMSSICNADACSQCCLWLVFYMGTSCE